jgi:hypothetical protein
MSQGYFVTRTIVRVLFWLGLIALALFMTGGDFR